MGGTLITTALAGKSAIGIYKAVQAGHAFGSGASQLGNMYKGGFERVMTIREACLILNVR